MLWTKADLEHQLARVKADGWLPFFKQAAAAHGFTATLLLAISSRETNCRNVIGDAGHGHGIMQIDNRSFPAWCGAGKWKDPQEAIRMGAWVLRQKLAEVPATISASNKLRVAIAGYNCGTKRAATAYRTTGNPDIHTTGHDYSADVLARQRVFAELIH